MTLKQMRQEERFEHHSHITRRGKNFVTDSDEDAIVGFVKDHKELYDLTSKHFKDKARKEFLWKHFNKCRNLSVKVCNLWFNLQRLRKADAIKVLQSPAGDDATSELDTEQVGCTTTAAVWHQLTSGEMLYAVVAEALAPCTCDMKADDLLSPLHLMCKLRNGSLSCIQF